MTILGLKKIDSSLNFGESYASFTTPLVAVLVGDQDDLRAVAWCWDEHVRPLDADHDVESVVDEVLHGDAVGEGLGHGEAGAVHAAGVLKVGRRDVCRAAL